MRVRLLGAIWQSTLRSERRSSGWWVSPDVLGVSSLASSLLDWEIDALHIHPHC